MFKGRLNRSTYLLATGFMTAVAAFLEYGGFISDADSGTITTTDIIIMPIAIFFIVWALGVSVRRLHDLGIPGILAVLIIFPLVPFVLVLLPGQKQKNKYGAPHRKNFDLSSALRGS